MAVPILTVDEVLEKSLRALRSKGAFSFSPIVPQPLSFLGRLIALLSCISLDL